MSSLPPGTTADRTGSGRVPSQGQRFGAITGLRLRVGDLKERPSDQRRTDDHTFSSFGGTKLSYGVKPHRPPKGLSVDTPEPEGAEPMVALVTPDRRVIGHRTGSRAVVKASRALGLREGRNGPRCLGGARRTAPSVSRSLDSHHGRVKTLHIERRNEPVENGDVSDASLEERFKVPRAYSYRCRS